MKTKQDPLRNYKDNFNYVYNMQRINTPIKMNQSINSKIMDNISLYTSLNILLIAENLEIKA